MRSTRASRAGRVPGGSRSGDGSRPGEREEQRGAFREGAPRGLGAGAPASGEGGGRGQAVDSHDVLLSPCAAPAAARRGRYASPPRRTRTWIFRSQARSDGAREPVAAAREATGSRGRPRSRGRCSAAACRGCAPTGRRGSARSPRVEPEVAGHRARAQRVPRVGDDARPMSQPALARTAAPPPAGSAACRGPRGTRRASTPRPLEVARAGVALGRAVARRAAADGDDAGRDALRRTGVLACSSRASKTELGRPSNCEAPSTTIASLTRPVVLPGDPPDARRGAADDEQAARTTRRDEPADAAEGEQHLASVAERGRLERARAAGLEPGDRARGTASRRRSRARPRWKKCTLSGSPPCSPQTPILRPGVAARPSSTEMRTSRPMPAAVDRLERADAEDAEVEVAREERRLDVVAAEAVAHLRQVVGAEGEEVGRLGDRRRR